MRKPANQIPNYLKYGSYIVAHNATAFETASAFGVTAKQVNDDVNHGLKKNIPSMYGHVKNIQTSRKAAQ